ncbi:sulfurtransferase TusA family protein [Alcaligenes endophyticus]|uniref:Sulfurtransferase TusA family protein n=1 Tax=Alcaligenes endophyticus TaxID=1929088 RepID=A0ABT8EIA1_9BURK|nr:sulfurtransferase TusA family protein [Alcaligenes endophyticus]MCX5592634.1 sulfurtransferase TusA family protein [Alcaligenes endophyticus]MDN4121018.1 sulfurtransferase TusA family protein [Alcaligenes endophyticus]
MTETAFDSTQVDLELDASGLKCPLPILRAKKSLAQLQSGQVLLIHTTDKHAVLDFQAFCQQTGNELLLQRTENEKTQHFLRRR